MGHEFHEVGPSYVSCCWALMLLIFVGGVTNVLWKAALTFFVLAERVLPRQIVLARARGCGADSLRRGRGPERGILRPA